MLTAARPAAASRPEVAPQSASAANARGTLSSAGAFQKSIRKQRQGMSELAGQRILQMRAATSVATSEAPGDRAPSRLHERVANRSAGSSAMPASPSLSPHHPGRRQTGPQTDQRCTTASMSFGVRGPSAAVEARVVPAPHRHDRVAVVRTTPDTRSARGLSGASSPQRGSVPRNRVHVPCLLQHGRGPRGSASRAHADLSAISQREHQMLAVPTPRTARCKVHAQIAERPCNPDAVGRRRQLRRLQGDPGVVAGQVQRAGKDAVDAATAGATHPRTHDLAGKHGAYTIAALVRLCRDRRARSPSRTPTRRCPPAP